MVFINDSKFTVYELDTIDTILDRITEKNNTLLKYLYFPVGEPKIEDFISDKNIKVEDVLSYFKGVDTPFSELYKKHIDKTDRLDIFNDLIVPYIVYNPRLINSTSNFINFIILELEQDIKEFFPNIKTEDIWKIREKYRKDLEDEINENKKTTRNIEKIYQDFSNITDIPKYTNFDLEKINFNIDLVTKSESLLEIFNYIQLNPAVPFAATEDIYKILKDFKPSSDWGITYIFDKVGPYIGVKINQKKDITRTNFKNYTDVYIYKEDEKIVSSLSLILNNQYLSRKEFIDRFFGIFKNKDIEVGELTERDVNGVYYYPNKKFNKFIFADLIMNNPVFSSIMAVNEQKQASKSSNSIYIHFNIPKLGKITANLTNKISSGEISGVKVGDRYIRVKITAAENNIVVKEFQKILGKILILYDNNYRELYDIYKDFISNFDYYDKIDTIKKKDLKIKDIAPEVFVTGYPQSCTKQPKIIEDEEVKQYEDKGYKVMRFPVEGTGIKVRNYICDYKQDKYPGLRENNLENKDILRYLPCCYKKDNSEKKGSLYRHYFYGEELKEKTDVQQGIIITDKFVKPDSYGKLPAELNKIFIGEFLRVGVANDNSSLINCVLRGLGKEENGENLRLTGLNKNTIASSCKQEMYDFTIEEIQNTIKNVDIYFKPKYFVPLLEKIYKVNIFIFNREGINTNLSLPRFLEAYYPGRKYTNSLFIYEHMGSTSDNAKNPRCELIVRWDKDEDITISKFDNTTEVFNIVNNNIYNKLKKAYALNNPITNSRFITKGMLENKGVRLENQYIDSYGKCRIVNLNWKNTIYSILCSPIPPFISKQTENNIPHRVSLDNAREFAGLLEIIISGQVVKEGVSKELLGILGNVKVAIPIRDSKPLDGVPNFTKRNISYITSNVSELSKFKKYKLLARNITEYMFWIYSNFINENGMNLDQKSIEEFQKKYFIIKPTYTYSGDISNKFSLDNSILDNGRIIIKSEETQKRLIYVLRLHIRRRREIIRNYYKREFIENYYSELTDFDQYSDQIILKGEDSVDKWLEEKRTKFVLTDKVKPTNIKPYFFKNEKISSDIFLAQNAVSLESAIDISETWYNDKYNPMESENKVHKNFTLYSYKSSEDISIHKFGDDKIKIIGYRVNDDPMFTALLSL